MRSALWAMAVLAVLSFTVTAGDAWVTYEGTDGPGKGKHVVLVSGDDEYRSEEMLPALGKILAKHHGFKCTVLFAIDKNTGEIAPTIQDNIPGLEALQTADLAIVFTRFRNLPAEQMKFIDDYTNSGKPIIGIRTATHAFNTKADHPYAKWHWQSKVEGFQGGWGKQVLGETWVAHHGHHGKESCRGLIAPGKEKDPLVRGCEDIWGPSDVYTVKLPLPAGCDPIIMGQVLTGMNPTDKPLEGAKNNPMMPIAWTKSWTTPGGAKARVFTSTMGCATDFQSEGFRRLMVNATFWALGMDDKIPEKANVEIVGDFQAIPFKFGGHRKGVKPSDHAMK